MTQATNKKSSIYAQLLRLLLVSAFAALAVFGILDITGNFMVSRYLEETDYIDRKNQEYIEKFQNYIRQKQLTSRDADALNTWLKKQKILSVKIYKDEIQVFDSDYPEWEIWEEEIAAGNYAWESYYIVEFADGYAEVIITGAYGYRFYNYVLIAELLFSFVLFLLLVLLGIRRKMDYIRTLSSEIEILEGGSLDYPITIKGKDELAALAEGLDSMRISFRKLIWQEAEIVRENQRNITEMSHDLRTPVTSIMLYTEILKKGKYKNEEQLMEYLEKIDQKAHRMKHLTDHLFEYSLLVGEEVELEEPEQYEILFYDLFSETCSYLEQKGFSVAFHVTWWDCLLRITTDYVMRILDNVTSNIVKYADASEPVEISSVKEAHMVGFIFENKIRELEEKVESTGIGIQNIKNMMKQMGGRCIVEEEGQQFRIILLFPCSEK